MNFIVSSCIVYLEERISPSTDLTRCVHLHHVIANRHILGRPSVSSISLHGSVTTPGRHIITTAPRSHGLPPQPLARTIDHRPYIYRCSPAGALHTHDIANIAISEALFSHPCVRTVASTAIRRHDARNREAPGRSACAGLAGHCRPPSIDCETEHQNRGGQLADISALR